MISVFTCVDPHRDFTHTHRCLFCLVYQSPVFSVNYTLLRNSSDTCTSRNETYLAHKQPVHFQVVKMLVAVVVLFAVSWGPILFNNVLVAFGVLEQLHLGWLKPMRQVFWLLAYLNSSLNPIVYGFMSKNFRESFRNTMWRCVLRKPPNKEPGANIYWRCSFQVTQSSLWLGVCSSSSSSSSRVVLIGVMVE